MIFYDLLSKSSFKYRKLAEKDAHSHSGAHNASGLSVIHGHQTGGEYCILGITYHPCLLVCCKFAVLLLLSLLGSVKHLEDDSTAESSPVQSHLDEAPAAQDR